MNTFLTEKAKTMTINKLMSYLDSIKHIEGRMKEIERMDKNGLSLDEQENLLDEYNLLWEKMNQKH